MRYRYEEDICAAMMARDGYTAYVCVHPKYIVAVPYSEVAVVVLDEQATETAEVGA